MAWFAAAAWAQALAAPAQPARAALGPADATPLIYCYYGKIFDPRLVVVDKSRQRVYVFRYLGRLMLEYEFPCATGERDGNKLAAGDERTPEGVYFITHRYQDRRITIFGDRALHINYPNACDVNEGRNGDGIYIHGTNKELKPRSSNGCITLANEDLALLEPLLEDDSTPIVVVDRLRLPTAEQLDQACDYIRDLDMNAMTGQLGTAGLEVWLVGNEDRAYKNDDMLQRLADWGGEGAVKAESKGLMLLGGGGQWVVVSRDQVDHGRGSINLARRVYLKGQSPSQLRALKGQFLLADGAAAKRLHKWLPAPKPATPAPVAAVGVTEEEKAIRAALRKWLGAWQNKDQRTYNSFYAADFSGDGMDRKAWTAKKAYLAKVYKDIRVKAENMEVQVKGDRAKVSFIQRYRSDWHRDVGRKELDLVRRDGQWLIVAERWYKLPGGA